MGRIDIAENYLTVTDLKNYVFCSRIVYFHRVQHLEPKLGAQQEESKELHQKLKELELRRIGAVFYDPLLRGAKKQFRVQLVSRKLRITGQIDMIIIAGRECVPVDFKLSESNKGKIWTDHKYQLVAYSLLIEEEFDTTVKRGFVYYVPENRAIELKMTSQLKKYVKKLIGKMWKLVEEEREPPIRVPLRRCTGGCGYLWVCRRIC